MQNMTTDRVLVQFKSNVVRAYSDDDLGVEFQKTAVGSIGVYTITDNMTVEEKVDQLSALRCELVGLLSGVEAKSCVMGCFAVGEEAFQEG